MPNLGPTELLILLVLLAVLVLLIRRGSSSTQSPPVQRLSASELYEQATMLTARNKKMAAIKLVREQTGLDLANAKR